MENEAKSNESNWWPTLRWKPTSLHDLTVFEKKMLAPVGIPYEQKLIKIGDQYINTIICGQGPPLVMLHGFGAGVGFWVCNLKEFSKHNTVYAIDLLGFGRSSRAKYKGDSPDEAEEYFMHSIENWRKAMNLRKFHLLGHSFGGYLSSVYALKHPERVHNLILADPWGIPERPDETNKKIPWKWRLVRAFASTFNPLSIIRLAGPYGPGLIERFRGDITAKFNNIYEDPSIVGKYIYHLNAQDPMGESAFSRLTSGIGWAKKPLMNRLPNLDKNIPVTFLYGSHTWMDPNAGFALKEVMGSRADFDTISNAGHHIYVDNFKSFNEKVVKAVLKYPLDPKEAFESPKEEIPDEKMEVIEDEIVKPRSKTFSDFSS